MERAESDHLAREYEEAKSELFDVCSERDGLKEQLEECRTKLDDMTGQFCNEAIHLTRAEDRVRELEEQLETLGRERDHWKREYEDACKSLVRRVHPGRERKGILETPARSDEVARPDAPLEIRRVEDA